MIKIYVGCSLTGAPQEFINSILSLKELLRAEGYEVMEFFGLGAGDATAVYEMDIHRCVAECDLLLAICDLPATGLGWELGTAVEKHCKPVLALAHKDAYVSRLPIGADCARNPHYRFERYESPEHIVLLVQNFLAERGLGLQLTVNF